MSNARDRSQAGFSLIELLVSTGILLIISSVVTSGLLQQEVGQAGRITLPAPITLSAYVNEGDPTATLSSVNGLFVHELVSFEGTDPLIFNNKPETVQITAINTGALQITVQHVSSK